MKNIKPLENMKKFMAIWALLISLIFAVSCNSGSKEPEVEIPAPQLLSANPSNGAVGVSENTTEITLIFNENVTLKAPHNITINGVAVSKASPGINKDITIVLPELTTATTYTLIIPANTVKGPTGVYIQNEIKSVFTTRVPSVRTFSKEAKNVMGYLESMYGKKTLSGTMANVNWNIEEAEWVYSQTGKYPVLNCFDFVHHIFSPANWIDYTNTSVVENWWNNNGLVAIMWHWNVPANDASKYSFYYGTASENTLFDVSKVSDVNSSEYKLMVKDIDIIAGYLKLLKTKKIPVIWRPLHEASGGWFWWGAKGADPQKKLWKLMFERLTEYHQLDNLIWVWTSEGNDSDWYPGDDYVDIVGRDIYSEANPHASQLVEFNKVKTIVSGKKMIALSECGGIPDPNQMFEKGDTWLWFMPWYGEHTRTEKWNGADYWKTVMDNSYVVTRDEMPNLK